MSAFLNFLSSSGGAGAITGAAGLLGGVLSGIESNKAAKTYNQGQMELAKYQFDKNLEMWNLQNQYNTPLAQSQRLKEAGLNPALMYSQGNVGNASGAPEFHMPQQVKNNSKADAINQVANAVTNALGQYLTLSQQEKQNKLLDTQIMSAKLDNLRKETENMFLPAYYDSRNRAMYWQSYGAYNDYDVAKQTKSSIIEHLLGQHAYDKFTWDWNKEFLPRQEQRDVQKLAIQTALMKNTLANDAFNRYRGSILLPYQLDSLKYGTLDTMERFLINHDLRENPWKGWNIPGTDISIGDAGKTAKGLMKGLIDSTFNIGRYLPKGIQSLLHLGLLNTASYLNRNY